MKIYVVVKHGDGGFQILSAFTNKIYAEAYLKGYKLESDKYDNDIIYCIETVKLYEDF